MPGNQIDLSQLFGQVVQSLSQNQGALNQADEYNKNHGDNMVEIFKLVTQALQEKKDAKPAAQLKYTASPGTEDWQRLRPGVRQGFGAGRERYQGERR